MQTHSSGTRINGSAVRECELVPRPRVKPFSHTGDNHKLNGLHVKIHMHAPDGTRNGLFTSIHDSSGPFKL